MVFHSPNQEKAYEIEKLYEPKYLPVFWVSQISTELCHSFSALRKKIDVLFRETNFFLNTDGYC